MEHRLQCSVIQVGTKEADMIATNYRGPYRIRADRNKSMPRMEHPNDAIIRVTRSLICGSDLHLYHGLVPDCRVGSVFGHEFTGIVEEIGSSVQNLKVGDHVVVPFNIACGSCLFCQHQLYGNCNETAPQSAAAAGFFGYSHTTGGYDGGQAEYVRVPFADVGPFIIPDDIDVDDAVLLADAYPTGYQAAEMAEIKPGDTVAIFGAGPVGIFAAKAAQWLGAGRVIVIDKEDYRLEFVKRFAQCEAYNFLEMDDPVLFLKRETDFLGPDSCIDAVGCEASGSKLQGILGVKMLIQAGSAVAVQWAINAVKKGGTVSVVGVYGPTANLIPLGNIVNKGITVRANQASVKRHIPHLIEHIRNGLIKPSEVLTHRVPLEEVADAYHLFSSKLDHCIKPVLIPPRAA
jgi:threonine dehydrogenase-like Zn-dependent dehydrogenase